MLLVLMVLFGEISDSRLCEVAAASARVSLSLKRSDSYSETRVVVCTEELKTSI